MQAGATLVLRPHPEKLARLDSFSQGPILAFRFEIFSIQNRVIPRQWHHPGCGGAYPVTAILPAPHSMANWRNLRTHNATV